MSRTLLQKIEEFRNIVEENRYYYKNRAEQADKDYCLRTADCYRAKSDVFSLVKRELDKIIREEE